MNNLLSLNDAGGLTARLGRIDFGPYFFNLFRERLQVDHCTVFAMRKELPPVPLFAHAGDDNANQQSVLLARSYATEGYVSDPNARRLGSGRAISRLSAKDLHADRYRELYYETPGLAHELLLQDDFQDLRIYASFYRSHPEKPFDNAAERSLAQACEFLVTLLHRHAELSEAHAATNTMSHYHALPAETKRERLLHAFSTHLRAACPSLTARELEVCVRIATGHSIEAIALLTDSRSNTVATHRKRAYRKLRISSQNEMFASLFDYLSGSTPFPCN